MPGLLGDLLRLGTVETVDLASATVIVRLGDILSPALPWFEIASAFRTWTPPAAGEQVMLLCPEGDIAHGVALRGIYSNAFPAPRTDGTARILMPDGSTIDYDPDGHVCAIALAGGKLTIDAPQGVEITGDVTITGQAHVSETVTADDDVIGGGIHLKTHKHGGVQAGAAQTGVPA